MKCPFCGFEDSKVVDSRSIKEGTFIRRRRECCSCKRRFTTYEYIESTPLMVVKNDGRREPYNREKLKMGLITACKKRPVRMDAIDSLIHNVEKAIDRLNLNEVPSKLLGEEVIKQLKDLDPVAYVRFASVYYRFEAVSEFEQKIKELAPKKTLKTT
ncbi:MAG: transcriptional repressor NrdR [Candidatus Glassbacteria bacterium]|nr:transcriptional repressor NrdR [Candidatus Glassbacteria bacterium]